jgi:hypothetical protein
MKEGKEKKERDGMLEEIKTGGTIGQMQIKLYVTYQFSKLNQNIFKNLFRQTKQRYSTLPVLGKQE